MITNILKTVLKPILFLSFSVFLIFSSFLNSQIDNSSTSLKKEFRSGEYCGQCHEREFEQWQNSMHSRSLLNQNFQNLFQTALKDTNGSIRPVCLKCHAPAAAYNNDLSFNNSRNSRPVNCEVCHSLTGSNDKHGLTFSGNGRLFSNNDAKMGDGHNVEKNARISKSEFCFPCHLHTNLEERLLVCSQDIGYEEWKKTTGRLDNCQDCHMRDSFGNVDHSFPGNSDPNMLEGTLNTRWNFSAGYSGYKVRVILHNSDVGHKVPAGMTLRKILVRVSLLTSDNTSVYRQEASLGKVYEDDEGVWPVMGWNAEKIRVDNAIAPLEKRMILFNIPARRRAAKVRLDILYSHHPGDENMITIFSNTKEI